MKKIMTLVFSILFMGFVGLSLAQSNTQNPNAHALHKRLRQQLRQIAVDLKSGKITETQAQSKRNNLKAIHDKVVQYKQQNGTHELTDGQAKELNSSLDKNKN